MLLLNDIISVTDSESKARVTIEPTCAFFIAPHGVAACIGLEYMGQTAALIAGLSLQQGKEEPQIGFLLGSRLYSQTVDFFHPGQQLIVHAVAGTVVGNQLANFNCTISDKESQAVLCRGTLSVMKKPLTEQA